MDTLLKKRKPILYILVLINVLSVATDLEQWMVALSLTFICWSFLSENYKNIKPPRYVVWLTAVVSALLVLNQYDMLWGVQSALALLALLVPLKLFESTTYRDMMFLTYLCFFVLMAKLLLSQTLFTTVFMGCDTVALLALMASFHKQDQNFSFFSLLKQILLLSILAIPILFIFFVLFPRFETSFFSRSQENTGSIGFSDQLKPGSISKLIQSEEVALRVSSDQEFPPLDHLYFRGSVLSLSKGLEWQKLKSVERHAANKPLDLSQAIHYDFILEPQFDRMLFSLDWPLWIEFKNESQNAQLERGDGFIFSSAIEFTTRSLYREYSSPDVYKIPWREELIQPEFYLNLEDVEAPRARLFVNQLINLHLSQSELISRLLEFYQQNFKYSLNPPLARNLDEFLFETRVGFCEHFAASFATLLRMAHIPSRVVLGFQGGTRSAFGNFVTVRNLDAHAWLEYYSKEQKIWRRLDPTSVVAPDRLRLGAERFGDSELQKIGQLSDRYPLLSKVFGSEVSQIYFRIRRMLDQGESSWIQFLLQFDSNFQKHFFEKFDFSYLKLFLFLILSSFVIFCAIYLVLRPRRRREDPVLKAYAGLLKKLKTKGFEKSPSEAPLEFENRVLTTLKEPELQALFVEWRTLRYSSANNSKQALLDFKKHVKLLRLS